MVLIITKSENCSYTGDLPFIIDLKQHYLFDEWMNELF